MLGNHCFERTKLRRLMLPSSVSNIGLGAFSMCENLQFADLRAAQRLRTLESQAFSRCGKLKSVLLGSGLENIEHYCFAFSGLDEIVIPGSAKRIRFNAF